MRYTADLHIHTDYDPERNRWEGGRPEKIAEGVVRSGVDVFAITEHNQVSERFFDTEDEVNSLLEGTGREVLALLGVEITVIYQDFKYHVGYIFEKRYTPHNLPAVPPPNLSIQDLEHYFIDYPGISILNHPTWKDHRGVNHKEVTEDFMASGLVDGVEILNGSILSNGTDKRIILSALEMFSRVRRTRFKVAAVGASDAHVGGLVGSVVTNFCTAEKEGIFDAIRTANTRAAAVTKNTRAKLKKAIESTHNGRAKLKQTRRNKTAKQYKLDGLSKYLVMPT